MPYFVFSAKLIPTENNEHKNLSGAYTHAWVYSESLKEARIRLFDYFMDSEWKIESIEVESESSLELHPRNQRSSQPADHSTSLALESTYQQLLAFQISAEIFAFQ